MYNYLFTWDTPVFNGTPMSYYTAEFAKAGNPNGEGLPQWDAYTRENGNVMIFDNQVEVKQHHDAKLQRLLAPSMKF